MNRKVYLLLSFVLFTGCSIQKPLIEEKVTAELLDSQIAITEEYQPKEWQDVFVDDVLQSLIIEGLSNNANVLTMQLNVEQAEQQMRMSRLAYLPSFVLSPSGTLGKASGTPMVKGYELPVTMSWELNLGGQLKAQKAQ